MARGGEGYGRGWSGVAGFTRVARGDWVDFTGWSRMVSNEQWLPG